jgi:hypothetical protein
MYDGEVPEKQSTDWLWEEAADGYPASLVIFEEDTDMPMRYDDITAGKGSGCMTDGDQLGTAGWEAIRDVDQHHEHIEKDMFCLEKFSKRIWLRHLRFPIHITVGLLFAGHDTFTHLVLCIGNKSRLFSPLPDSSYRSTVFIHVRIIHHPLERRTWEVVQDFHKKKTGQTFVSVDVMGPHQMGKVDAVDVDVTEMDGSNLKHEPGSTPYVVMDGKAVRSSPNCPIHCRRASADGPVDLVQFEFLEDR